MRLRGSIVWFLFIFLATEAGAFTSQDDGTGKKNLVYKFDIKKPIGPPTWRIMQKSFEEADSLDADYIIIHMNTYGGLVDAADSMRTRILNSDIPVYVFIDNNAASAGALISIACEKIYMRRGSTIGAATVVDQQGTPAPDKYQSYMRATMRATAEAQGYDTLITENDTVLKWKRDPQIAEAMVDPKIYIEGIIDTGQVLTFTSTEAIRFGYCEGEAENIAEVLDLAGIEEYEIRQYVPSGMEKLIGLLINPFVSGILIMIIIGGIYFELQSPGIGFPLGAAILAAIIYFAPLYLEGMAENWEIILFVLGIILVGLEIFAIPGFGIAGISGIVLIVIGLSFSMVDNVEFEIDTVAAMTALLKAIVVVLVSMVFAFLISLYLSKTLFTSNKLFANWALNTTQERSEGYIGVEKNTQSINVGKIGIATTILRPSGKVMIEDRIYDAKSEFGFIDKGEKIKVLREETGQIYVMKV